MMVTVESDVVVVDFFSISVTQQAGFCETERFLFSDTDSFFPNLP